MIKVCLITEGKADAQLLKLILPERLTNSPEVRIIDGDGRFPSFIAGTWRADRGGWEIVFEPDGKISSAVVSLGRVRIRPGQVTTTAEIKGTA